MSLRECGEGANEIETKGTHQRCPFKKERNQVSEPIAITDQFAIYALAVRVDYLTLRRVGLLAPKKNMTVAVSKSVVWRDRRENC